MLSRLLLVTLSLISVELIEVHAPNGKIVYLNLHEITTLREPTQFDIDHYFNKSTHCVVVTTTGKFLATKETCKQIHDLVEQHNAKQE